MLWEKGVNTCYRLAEQKQNIEVIQSNLLYIIKCITFIYLLTIKVQSLVKYPFKNPNLTVLQLINLQSD